MKTIARFVLSLSAAAALAACATTSPRGATGEAPATVPCSLLSWDECGVAPHCRPGRAWEEVAGTTTETWICEARYEPLGTPLLAEKR